MQATFLDRAVYLPAFDAAVVADLHVGRAEASDVDLPLGEGTDLAERFETVLAAVEPAELVVAGDVVHEFGGPGDRAVERLDDLTETCRGAGTEPVLVAGNHDAGLADVWDGVVRDSYRLEAEAGGGGDSVGDVDRQVDDEHPSDTVVHHGHEPPAVDAERYVVGHDHPAIEVEGRRRPCYLHGRRQHRGREVLMLPAFTRLARGTVVNGMAARDFQSPLVRDADALRPIVRDVDAGETLRFPPLGEFRSML